MNRRTLWSAVLGLLLALAGVGPARADLPAVQFFTIDLGQEFASDVAPIENSYRAMVMFTGSEPRKLALADADTLSVLDGPFGAPEPNVVPLGGAVVGRRLYVSQWNGLANVDIDNYLVANLFEPAPGTIWEPAVSPVVTSAAKRRLFTIAAGHVLAVEAGSDAVTVLGQVEYGYYGIALSEDERWVYVADTLGRLRRFDSERQRPPETVSFVTSIGTVNSLVRLAVDYNGSIYVGYNVFVDGSPRFQVSVFDFRMKPITRQTYGFASTGMDLSVDKRLLVLGNGHVADARTLGILARAPLGGASGDIREVHAVAVPPSAYVTNSSRPDLAVIDLRTLPELVSLELRAGGPNSRLDKAKTRQLTAVVLSTAERDARSVDPATLCFGSGPNPESRACANALKSTSLRDINGDGRPDLLLSYDPAATGIVSGDLGACLSGRTYASTPIAGCALLKVFKR